MKIATKTKLEKANFCKSKLIPLIHNGLLKIITIIQAYRTTIKKKVMWQKIVGD